MRATFMSFGDCIAPFRERSENESEPIFLKFERGFCLGLFLASSLSWSRMPSSILVTEGAMPSMLDALFGLNVDYFYWCF